jgi:type I restriction enzyme S subunit
LTKEKAESEIITLGSVIDKPRYGTSKKCSLEPKGLAVLRIPNIGEGLINPEELKYAEFDAKEISTLKLQEGDILTIRSNGSVDLVGKCALITKNDVDYLYAGYLIRLRPDKELIDSKFLLYSLKSHDLRVQIESKAKSTSGVNNINSVELASLEIPHFKLEIQHQIVQEIESRLSVCDKVEESISESLEKAKALRQSILKKAFEGTLLSEDKIAACKAAKDYEPASVLLEKIKAEKKK